MTDSHVLKLKILANELKTYDNNILLRMSKNYLKLIIYDRNNTRILIYVYSNIYGTFDLETSVRAELNKFNSLISKIFHNGNNNKTPKQIYHIYHKLKYQICLSFEDV